MPLSRNQFVALMAMLMAINALSIDIMLPGLQEIGASLGVTDENSRQLVITSYLIGMGSAQLFFGPLSDRFGRKLPLLAGLALYALCALASVFVPPSACCWRCALRRGSARRQRASSASRSCATSMAGA